jgi:hypothetical protein
MSTEPARRDRHVKHRCPACGRAPSILSRVLIAVRLRDAPSYPPHIQVILDKYAPVPSS